MDFQHKRDPFHELLHSVAASLYIISKTTINRLFALFGGIGHNKVIVVVLHTTAILNA